MWHSLTSVVTAVACGEPLRLQATATADGASGAVLATPHPTAGDGLPSAQSRERTGRFPGLDAARLSPHD